MPFLLPSQKSLDITKHPRFAADLTGVSWIRRALADSGRHDGEPQTEPLKPQKRLSSQFRRPEA